MKRMKPLPVELWMNIFKMLSKRQLAVLCKICVLFRDIAQPILFQEVSAGNRNPWTLNWCILFNRSLTKRPTLAGLVWILTIEENPHVGWGELEPPTHPVLPKLATFRNLRTLTLGRIHVDSDLHDVLQLLPRLNSVVFDGCEISPNFPAAYPQHKRYHHISHMAIQDIEQSGWGALILPGLTSLRLEISQSSTDPTEIFSNVLAHGLYSLTTLEICGTSGPISVNIIAFLVTCTQLRYFRADPELPPEISSLPSQAIPLLEHFSGGSKYMEIFVRGRPVSTAVVKLQDYAPVDILRSLRSTSVPITTLDLDGQISPEMLQHAPSTLKTFIWHAPGDVESIQALLPVLSKMPDLRRLKGDYWPRNNFSERKSLMQAASTMCSALREFELWLMHRRYDRDEYNIWTKQVDGTWSLIRQPYNN